MKTANELEEKGTGGNRSRGKDMEIGRGNSWKLMQLAFRRGHPPEWSNKKPT